MQGGPHESTDPQAGAFDLCVVDELCRGDNEFYEINHAPEIEAYITRELFPSIRAASKRVHDDMKKELAFSLQPDAFHFKFLTQPLFNSTGDLVVGINYKE